MISVAKSDHGAQVTYLQKLLVQAGFSVEADGWFGDQTESAVKLFQRQSGLVADGKVGPKTWAALSGGGVDQKSLSERDMARAAERLGVSLAAIKAVTEVESRGHGFFDDGRPVILYERHVAFSRAMNAGLSSDQANALAEKYPNLVNEKRGGYIGGSSEWSRLASAKQILPDGIAESSCSWGMFQIMGYYWQHLGYESITDFVASMQSSEAMQLEAFCRFIEADPALHAALKNQKWAVFARGYNGPAFKENLYDVKLARACLRYSSDLLPA